MTTRPDTLDIPDTTIASFSDLGTFGQCRRQWFFRTYRKLRLVDEPPTGPLPFGSRIHKALEAFYDGTVETPVQAWQQLMAHEYAVAEANGNPFIDGLDKESALGHRMLEGYVEWLETDGEDAYWETLSTERPLVDTLDLVIEVDGVEVLVTILIRGKLDRDMVRKSDGARYVGDFKTMANFGEPAMFGLQHSPQPRIYLDLLEANDGEDNYAGIVYTLLRKVMRTPRATPPFYKRHVIEINKADRDAYRVRLIGAVEQLAITRHRLDQGVDHRRAAHFNTGWWCGTCPFKLPCDLMQHSPAGAEDMLRDLYTEGDPWARYASEEPADEPSGPM